MNPPSIPSSGPAKQPTDKQKMNSSRRGGHKARASPIKSRKARRRRETGPNSENDEDSHPSDSDAVGSDDLRAEEDEEFETTEDSTMGTRRVTDETTEVDVKVEEDEHGLPRPKPSLATRQSSHVENTDATLEMDEDDEPKPKLSLELKYRAFSNFNRCICVVVEPWPPQRTGSRAPSVALSAVAGASTATSTTSEFSANRGQRAKTPLFFPDVDDEPTIPTSGHTHLRTLPPVPLFDDPPTTHDTNDVDEWGDSDALMQFSQMLNTTGRVGGADVEEEDEFDGTTLFADADEAREL
jgi:hypothetical protein